jgi:prepilin-type N-terminal cleavage/methylation domain-containing protein
VRLIDLARRRTSTASDAGFSLMEVIVAVFILTIVMGAATAFFLNNAHSVGGQSQRQNAVYIADQQLEAVRSVPPAKLLLGRTSAAVTTLHATSGASTFIAQDDTSGGNYDTAAVSGSTQEIPTTQTKTVNSVAYTVRTFINRCWYDPTTELCGSTSSSTTTQEYRVTVAVTWTPTGNRACSGGCAYSAVALIDPNGDPKFNSNISHPAISGTSPSNIAVTKGDGTFIINGTEFVNGATVTISSGGGTFGTVTTNSGTQITLPFTAGTTPGSYVISVVNPDGGRATTSFTENALPSIVTVTPSPSPLTGATSTTLTLDGTGFQNGATVTATNGVTIGSVTWVSATQLRLNNVMDAADGGSSVITVTNPDTGDDTATVVFKSKPSISSITPNPRVGQSITLAVAGAGFQNGATVTASSGTVTSVAFVSASQVNVTYSAAATGTVTFTLTNPDAATTTGTAVAKYPAPTASSLTIAAGGTALTKGTNAGFRVAGTGFQSGAQITSYTWTRVGFAPVTTNTTITPTALSATQVDFTVPVPTWGSGTRTYTLTVTIVNPDGQSVTVTGAQWSVS